MQVNVEKLRAALKLVAPAVPRKPTLAILSNIRLGEGKVIATDLDTAITIIGIGSVDDAPLCLPHKTLLAFLEAVPGRETLIITHQDGNAELTAGRARATLEGTPALDYPPIPNPTPEHVVAVDGDDLVRALTAVLYCAAGKDDTRPVLQSVCLTLGDTPEAGAADGFRLAWESLHIKLPGEGELLIPGTAVKDLDHLWRHAPKPPDLEGAASPAQIAMAKRLVKLAYTKDTLSVAFGAVSFITKLTAGSFPNYRQLIPPPGSTAVTFNAEDLWRALKGIGHVALDGSGIIRLSWGDSELKAEARAEKVGTVSAVVSSTCTAPGRIAFNLRYLQEYLREKPDDVTLSTGADGKAPGLFSYHGTARFALMPMFVQWGDEPKAPEPPEAEPEDQEGTDATPSEAGPEPEEEPTPAPEPAPAAPKRPSAAKAKKARPRRKKAKK